MSKLMIKMQVMVKKLKHFLAVQALKLAVEFDLIEVLNVVRNRFETKPYISLSFFEIETPEKADQIVRNITGKTPFHYSGYNETHSSRWAQWDQNETKNEIHIAAHY